MRWFAKREVAIGFGLAAGLYPISLALLWFGFRVAPSGLWLLAGWLQPLVCAGASASVAAGRFADKPWLAAASGALGAYALLAFEGAAAAATITHFDGYSGGETFLVSIGVLGPICAVIAAILAYLSARADWLMGAD